MNFDATTTSGLSGSDYDNSNWTWDFNDPNDTHKTTIGYVVGHVFDIAGTYNVQTMVRDVSGAVGFATTTITVSAPSWTTYYTASSGSDSNNGTSTSTPFATFAKALTMKGTNVRLLFRMGDTFNIGTTDYGVNATGPFLIGEYFDSGSPSSNAPILSSTAPSGSFIGVFSVGGSDITFQDIHAVSTNGVFTMFGISGSNNSLLERVENEGYGAVSPAGSIGAEYDNTETNGFMVDCNFHDFSGYAVYNGGMVGASFIGNKLTNFVGQDHGIRFSAGTNNYVAENTCVPGTASNSTFDCFVFRGDGDNNSVAVNNIAARDIGAAPTNTSSLEHITHVLFEGNYVYSNTVPADTSSQGFNIGSQHVVIRNNVINTAYCMNITGPSLTPANYVDFIYIYNNTCYYPGVAGHLTDTMAFLNRVTSTGTNWFLRDNIWEEGGTPGNNFFIQTDGSGSTTEDHNLGYAPNVSGSWTGWPGGTGDITGDPKFVAPGTDFSLQSGSPALDVGANTHVYSSFNSAIETVRGSARPQNSSWDMGAFERKNP